MATRPKWKVLESHARRFFANLCHFVDTITDDDMISFVLSHTSRLVVYMVPLPGYAKKFTKRLLSLWGKHEKQSVRVSKPRCLMLLHGGASLHTPWPPPQP